MTPGDGLMGDVTPGPPVPDDALPSCMSLSSVLTALRYAFRAAPDALTAQAEFRREVPDLILSDMNMPSIRVIAISGASSGESVPRGVAADALYPMGTHQSSLRSNVGATARPGQSPLVRRPVPWHPSGSRLTLSPGSRSERLRCCRRFWTSETVRPSKRTAAVLQSDPP